MVINLEGEVWKTVPDLYGYEISNLGRVKSLPKAQGFGFKKETVLEGFLTRKGYHKVNLKVDKKAKGTLVHRLVAMAFLPNPNNLPEVNHKNGIKTDNRIENLEWVTHSENMRHALENDLHARGEERKNSKLKDVDIPVIRSMRASGMKMHEISKHFNVARQTVNSVLNGTAWIHV